MKSSNRYRAFIILFHSCSCLKFFITKKVLKSPKNYKHKGEKSACLSPQAKYLSSTVKLVTYINSSSKYFHRVLPEKLPSFITISIAKTMSKSFYTWRGGLIIFFTTEKYKIEGHNLPGEQSHTKEKASRWKPVLSWAPVTRLPKIISHEL